MPTPDTFDCPPIGDFVKKYLRQSKISIDPFARNKRWATYTNDLNPDTAAEYHVDALEFLQMLKVRSVVADLIIFDPPYSLQQVMQCYAGVGRQFLSSDAQDCGRWTKEKDICQNLLVSNGVFLHFGWHSNGIGKERGFSIEELLIVAHGSAHNDTICIAERKMGHQPTLSALFECASSR